MLYHMCTQVRMGIVASAGDVRRAHAAFACLQRNPANHSEPLYKRHATVRPLPPPLHARPPP